MTLTFTPTDKQLKLAKVMESPALREILKKMEDGFTIRSLPIGHVFWENEYSRVYPLYAATRNIQTLESAGLIVGVSFDDYIEYRLTYQGTFEELVRHETRAS